MQQFPVLARQPSFPGIILASWAVGMRNRVAFVRIAHGFVTFSGADGLLGGHLQPASEPGRGPSPAADSSALLPTAQRRPAGIPAPSYEVFKRSLGLIKPRYNASSNSRIELSWNA